MPGDELSFLLSLELTPDYPERANVEAIIAELQKPDALPPGNYLGVSDAFQASGETARRRQQGGLQRLSPRWASPFWMNGK